MSSWCDSGGGAGPYTGGGGGTRGNLFGCGGPNTGRGGGSGPNFGRATCSGAIDCGGTGIASGNGDDVEDADVSTPYGQPS